MSLRNILIILGTLVYFVFCYKYFDDNFFSACCAPADTALAAEDSNSAVIQPSVQKSALKPITFSYNSAEPQTTEEFQNLKDELIAASKENDILDIKGYYFDSEDKPEDYGDMGLYRAMQIIELISPPLDQDKITTSSEKIEESDDAKENNFESHMFSWQTKEESDEPTISTNSDGDIRILFAENTTKFEESEALNDYLNELAEKLKGDKTLMAYVVGHADKSGSSSANQRLSESRARKIRRILRNKGVSSRQLKAIGRGEHQSIAPNDNEAGKRLNRRVEIKIDTLDK